MKTAIVVSAAVTTAVLAVLLHIYAHDVYAWWWATFIYKGGA